MASLEGDAGQAPEINDVLTPEAAEYGVPAAFARGRRLRFADFDLQYVDQQIQVGTQYRTWRFRVTRDAEETMIELGSGGVISEGVVFRAGARAFTIDWIRPAAGTNFEQIVVAPAP